jgi:multicomponent Na+:H+ antiporter subunit C
LSFSRIVNNFNYVFSALLFLMGLYTVAVKPNLVKKLLIVSIGMVKGGEAPIVEAGVKTARMVNPIPQALILTGIVVAVSTTAVALSLCIRIHEKYGTLDAGRILGREVDV